MNDHTGRDEPRKNVLKVPEGKTPEAVAMDLMKAQADALVAIPQLLSDLASELSVIALYCEKKGLKEALFTEDELNGGGNNEIG